MACQHMDQIRDVPLKHAEQGAGCEECLKSSQRWVHLRECLVCGHVGCCDSSIGKHATRHFQHTKHAIMRSIEPGEDWGWCYEDEEMLAFS